MVILDNSDLEMNFVCQQFSDELKLTQNLCNVGVIDEYSHRYQEHINGTKFTRPIPLHASNQRMHVSKRFSERYHLKQLLMNRCNT
jgi:hypothetical protein